MWGLMLAALFSCKQDKNAYVIEGSLEGLEDAYVYFIHPAELEQQVDTIEVKKGGKFKIKGVIQQADMYFISADGMEQPIEVFLEPGKFKIVGKANDNESWEVTGGSLNEQYKAYRAGLKPVYDEYVAFTQQAESMSDEDFEAGVRIISRKYQNKALELVEAQPVTQLSAYLIASELLYDPQVKRLDAILEKMDQSIKDSRYGQIIQANLESARKTAVGTAAPLFTMNDMEGNQISLESYQGKYVLVDFWAAWCRPCRQENPRLVALYAKHKGPKFEILGVSIDRSKEQWKQAVRDDQLTWTQVLDESEVSAVKYGIVGIPANVLLDPQGVIVAKNLFGRELDETLTQLLSGKPDA